ncbi:pepsin/retropepsin-like aspartic protease family protein [Spongiimicrobium salis]|uniref:pepsin/retropepsin-like aspartic protease family protein n=1 Tax=Spongiimicrobium salis TaxID=1667022 RepID=UPI00374C9E8B
MKHGLLFIFLLSQYVSFAQHYEIPFEKEETSNYIYLEITVNDSAKKLRFVFDTGVKGTVIDKSVAEELGIKPKYIDASVGVTGADVAEIATKQQLHFKEFTLKRIDLALIDLSHISTYLNEKIDGIIGSSLISKFITYVDIETKKIKLFRRVKDISNLELFTQHSITLINEKPILRMGFTPKNGTYIEGDFCFDTGFSGSLSVANHFVEKYQLEKKVGDTYSRKSLGITKDVGEELMGHVQSMRIDKYIFENVPTSLSITKQGSLGANSYLSGLLGNEIIYRFQIILDYKHKTIYLKPNKAINNPF